VDESDGVTGGNDRIDSGYVKVGNQETDQLPWKPDVRCSGLPLRSGTVGASPWIGRSPGSWNCLV